MSQESRLWRIAAAVVAGLLSCGIPLWPLAYDQVSMPGNPSAAVWLLGAGASGVLAATLLRPGWGLPILSVVSGFVLAVMGRVGVETSRDPTSHNLWPFEVIIAGSIGFAGALLGVAVVRIVQRVARGR